jgi:hypothetical protein
MNDTTEKVERSYRAMLMQRTGEERMRMAFGMFQFARSLVRAAVRDQHEKRSGIANISIAAETAEVFRRMYSSDFDAETLQRIARHLAVRPDT